MASRIPKKIGKAQAREEFSTLIESVAQGGGAVEITDYGKVAAVLVSEEEYAWLRSCENNQAKPKKDARGFFVLEGDINLKEESKAIAEDFEKSIKKSARRLLNDQ
jgi:prevent-host-death family protein